MQTMKLFLVNQFSYLRLKYFFLPLFFLGAFTSIPLDLFFRHAGQRFGSPKPTAIKCFCSETLNTNGLSH
jgi:hypothetical protein